jgi:hypothetical protein
MPRLSLSLPALLAAACVLPAGGGDGAPVDAGPDPDGLARWSFVGVPGSQCALGAQAGLGYSPGAADELVIFLEGGGACWNDGTCHPSLYQWGPVCNYGRDAPCLFDDAGGTRPLSVNVDAADPYPADGGGVFPTAIAGVARSLLFSRRADNPLAGASFVFVPYCTGDLHGGDAVRTYQVRDAAGGPLREVTHRFAGATNMDAYLAHLRARHPSVTTIWLTGVSAGGYGASLNLHRVRGAFPEATVHLLADSAPLLDTPYFATWQEAWNLQTRAGCADCATGFPAIIADGIDADPAARVALLSYAQDAVLTRYFFSPGTTDGWLNPPFGSYVASLAALEDLYDARGRAEYFRLGGQSHVMLQHYGMIDDAGELTDTVPSPDGATTLRAWIDAWIAGDPGWASHR